MITDQLRMGISIDLCVSDLVAEGEHERPENGQVPGEPRAVPRPDGLLLRGQGQREPADARPARGHETAGHQRRPRAALGRFQRGRVPASHGHIRAEVKKKSTSQIPK